MSSAIRSPRGLYLAGSADSKSGDLSPGCHGESCQRGQPRDRSGSLLTPPFPRYRPASSLGRYPRLCGIVLMIPRLRGTDMISVPVQTISAPIGADAAAVRTEEVLRHDYAAERCGRSPADGPG